jgi:hypothetical protein
MANKLHYFKDEHGRILRVAVLSKGEVALHLITPEPDDSRYKGDYISIPYPKTRPVSCYFESITGFKDLQKEAARCPLFVKKKQAAVKRRKVSRRRRPEK